MSFREYVYNDKKMKWVRKFTAETKLKVFTAFAVVIIFGLVSFFYFAITTIY